MEKKIRWLYQVWVYHYKGTWPDGEPKLEDSRQMALVTSLKEAKRIVENNVTDIHECYYEKASIFKDCPGLVYIDEPKTRWDYIWNRETGKYELTEELDEEEV